MKKIFIQLTILTFIILVNAFASDKKTASAISRIGIKNREFVNLETGEKFVPRGFNYARLHKGWHSTFGRNTYEPERYKNMLRDLHTNGFNIVRVFVDQLIENGIVESKKSETLSQVYMSNVCDFLKRAAKNNVYVVFTFPMLPQSKQYSDLFDKERPDIIGINQIYLTRGAIKAKAKYLSDFVRWIKNKNPELLPAVFSYELCNEAAMVVDKPPFSLKKGFIIPATVEAIKHVADQARENGFQGFMYWTYDTDEQKRIWNGKSGKGEIMEELKKIKF